MIRLIKPSPRLYLIGNNNNAIQKSFFDQINQEHADKQGRLYQNC